MDIGGQSQFWNLWAEDIFTRKPNVVFFMIDDRILKYPQHTRESVASLKYLVDNITGFDRTKLLSKKARKNAKKGYKPELFCFLINKMDLWWTPQAQYLWDKGLQREHPIVYPFRGELRRLRKSGIQAEVEAISAQHGLKTLLCVGLLCLVKQPAQFPSPAAQQILNWPSSAESFIQQKSCRMNLAVLSSSSPTSKKLLMFP